MLSSFRAAREKKSKKNTGLEWLNKAIKYIGTVGVPVEIRDQAHLHFLDCFPISRYVAPPHYIFCQVVSLGVQFPILRSQYYDRLKCQETTRPKTYFQQHH